MAISQVRVKVNGTWTTLTLNASTGKYEGTIVAPATTSWNLANQYYPVEVEATNDAGTVVTVNDQDASVGSSLRLVVKETVKPVITINSPSSGANMTNNKPKIEFTVTDAAGGSGVDQNTVKLVVDSTTYTKANMTVTDVTNGYKFSFTPSSALADGSHTIKVTASDHDGNAATQKTATFKVDTVPPTLTVSSPTIEITNKKTVTVAGVTNDVTSSPVTLTVSVNGGTATNVTVDSSGNFTTTVTLAEGSNTITVVATDAAGKSTTVTKTIKLDTSIPKISNVTLAPNPVNTSATVTITLEVS